MEIINIFPRVSGLLLMLIVFANGQFSQQFVPQPEAGMLLPPSYTSYNNRNNQPQILRPNTQPDYIPQRNPPIPESFIPSVPAQPSSFGSQPESFKPTSLQSATRPVQSQYENFKPLDTQNTRNSGSSFDQPKSNSDLQTSNSSPQSSIISSPISPGTNSGSSVHPVSTPGSRSRHHKSRNSPPKDPLGGMRIVCLFNSKHFYKSGFTPAFIDPSLCTHLNYEFAFLDPKTYEMITGEPDLDINENFYQEAIDLKKSNTNLKVLLSLGGWEDSTKKYSDMADDATKRKNFIEKAVIFLKSHEFDGLDLAWEYPNCWQGAIHISPKDKKNFVTLLKEMQPEFKKNNLILSVSVGAIKREIDAAYDVPEISKAVDYINVMTYDMHGPWEKKTGHHTQFEALPGDSDPYSNVKSAMKEWAERGADKKKLNLGLALYGKSFTLENPNKLEMGSPAVGIGNPGPVSDQGGFLFYNEICQLLNSGNWTEEEEKHAGYYAHYGDQWACYDPPMMMVKKAKYVVEEGYGGVLLKDLSGDDYNGVCFSMPYPLLKMIRLEIIQKVRRRNRIGKNQ